MQDTKLIWKPIPDYEGFYEVSNTGLVKSLARISKAGRGGVPIQERIMKTRIDKYGYCQIKISKDGTHKRTCVHRLVALAFIPNPENKPQVNHINCIKTDNNVKNLEWNTVQENITHAVANNLRGSLLGTKRAYKVQQPKRRIAVNQFSLTGEFIKRWDSMIAACEFLNSNAPQHISYCCKGKKQQFMGFKWSFDYEAADKLLSGVRV